MLINPKRLIRSIGITSFLLMSFSFQQFLIGQCDPHRDSLALVDFFTEMNGNNWNNNKGWTLPGTPINEWYGIEVNDSGCVQKILLPVNAIAGDLPESFGGLTELTQLKLTACVILSLPTTLGGLQNLTEIDFNNAGLPVINESFGELKALKKLKISGLFSELPESFTQLSNLEELKLRGQNFSSLPESFGDLRKLKLLDLRNNELTSLPQSFGQLIHLEELNLARNKLTEFPDSLANLRQLKRLGFQGNSFELLPAVFGELDSLEIVNLSECGITEIADDALDLPLLVQLNLSENNLRSIPSTIGNSHKLEYLFLQNNQIEELPESIGQLTALKEIDLDFNNLTSLPQSFGQLKALEVLRLSYNDLTTPPNMISGLVRLKILTLWLNKLCELPPGLDLLENLEFLDIAGNRLSFEDLYPIKSFIDSNKVQVIYEFQDWPFPDSILCRNLGGDVIIDLNIDSGITNNTYTWFKDSKFYKEIPADNTLTFSPAKSQDVGVYEVTVKNPDFPDFWLFSNLYQLDLALPGAACLPTKDDPGFLISQGFRTDSTSETALKNAAVLSCNTITCYPLPATTEVNCSCSSPNDIQTLRLFTLNGQPVNVKYQYSSRNIELQTGDLPPGMYLLHIETVESILRSKIVIGAN